VAIAGLDYVYHEWTGPWSAQDNLQLYVDAPSGKQVIAGGATSDPPRQIVSIDTARHTEGDFFRWTVGFDNSGADIESVTVWAFVADIS